MYIKRDSKSAPLCFAPEHAAQIESLKKRGTKHFMGFGKNANNLPKTVWRTANGISEIPFAIIY